MWGQETRRFGRRRAGWRSITGPTNIIATADEHNRYCLGALLLDLGDPGKVLARSDQPIMEPITEYEKVGFFGSVVFTNGMVVEGDRILMYYGASDQVVCGAALSLREILASLHTL